MKKLLQLLIPIVLQAPLCSAQNAEWGTYVGGSGVEDVMGITTDGAGNVYSIGSFEGTAAAGLITLTSAGQRDAFVVKQGASGNFQWAKSFGGTAHDYGRKVRTDAAGNVYVMGYFSGTVDFDPGTAVNNLTSQSSGSLQDLFIVKLDASGNFVWAVQRQAPGGQLFVDDCDIKLDAANNLYLAYTFGDGYASNHVKIEKAGSSNGATTWIKSVDAIGAGSQLGYSNLALDGSGNILLAGEFGGDVDFDPGAASNIVTGVVAPTAYVLKLDNAGSFVWVKIIGNVSGVLTRAFDVTADGAGNVILAGRFGGTVDFDPGAGVHNETAAVISAYILKLSSAGAFSWVRTWGGAALNSAFGVATDAADAIYTTGFFSIDATFGVPPTTITFNTNINTYNEAYTVKFNSGGSVVWAQHMGGGLGDYAMGNAIAVSNLGAVFTGGSFDNGMSFSSAAGTLSLSSQGSTDGFVIKMQGCAPVNAAVTLSGSTLTASTAGATYQWINCATSAPVAGATAQTFTPTLTGNYAVVVMQGGCGNTSVCTPVIGTGVADVQQAGAAIYPNPTTGAVSVELTKRYANVEVVITSAIGAVVSRTVYTDAQSISANIDGANGIYFISVAADGETIARQRLVKAN